MQSSQNLKPLCPETSTLAEYTERNNQIKKARREKMILLTLIDDEQQFNFNPPGDMSYRNSNSRGAMLVALALLITALLTGILGIYMLLNPEAIPYLWR